MSTEREQLLAVSEIFGPTIQGEGLSAGMPAVFLRLAGCNLACVWCDTPYTWDWTRFDPKQEIRSMSVRAVYQQISAMLSLIRGRHAVLVITGGEPMLQQRALIELLELAYTDQLLRAITVEIETAGTIAPLAALHGYVDCYNVSPKLAHSGNPAHKALKPEVLRAFAEHGDAVFKFVVQQTSDLDDIDALVMQHHIAPRRVLIMMEGKTETEQQERLSALVTQTVLRGYRISPRLHVQIWGNRRGV